MVETNVYVESLKNLYDERKTKNTSYSLRAFARDLGVDNGNLIRILNNETSVTPKLAYKIALELQLRKEEILEFLLPSLK